MQPADLRLVARRSLARYDVNLAPSCTDAFDTVAGCVANLMRHLGLDDLSSDDLARLCRTSIMWDGWLCINIDHPALEQPVTQTIPPGDWSWSPQLVN